MGCGCGGNGNGGGCAGGSVKPVASPDKATQAGVQTYTPPAAATSAAATNETAADEQDEEPASAPRLIASSEQLWPRISVNGVVLAESDLARELQYHPASSRQEAIYLASQALVLRELIRQRVAELNIPVVVAAGENAEEVQTRALLEREVPLPQADAAACRQYFDSNRAHFASAPLLAARHILLACAPDDVEGRDAMRAQAEDLLAQLRRDGSRFAALAQAHSACPSKAQGGALGQISQGQTVPEFERQLFRLPPGLASQPLESRYGFHVVWVDQRIEGRPLPFEAVHDAIRDLLDQRVWQVAVAQYLKNLVGAADIRGIVLEGADSPLMQ